MRIIGHQENGKVSEFPVAAESRKRQEGPLVAFDDEGLFDIGEYVVCGGRVCLLLLYAKQTLILFIICLRCAFI